MHIKLLLLQFHMMMKTIFTEIGFFMGLENTLKNCVYELVIERALKNEFVI